MFPYLSYFQLLYVSDTFVFYDDVQYMKNGWINRNRILLNKKPHYLTFPVQRKALGTSINNSFFIDNIVQVKNKMIKTLYQAYNKAPYFDIIFPKLQCMLESQESNVAQFAEDTVLQIVDYLGINVKTVSSQ